MTAPGEPRIQINPDESARATLPEWIEVGEEDGDMVRIFHIQRRNEWNAMGPVTTGSLRMHRRDLCALADYVAMALWRPGDSEDGDGNEGVTGVSAPKEEETPAPTHRERENP